MFKCFNCIRNPFFNIKFLSFRFQKVSLRPSSTFSYLFHKSILFNNVNFQSCFLRKNLDHHFIKDSRLLSSLPPSRRRNMSPANPISWTTVFITVFFGTALILAMKAFKQNKEEQLESELIKSYGRPELGGDFELVNQDGEVKSNRDFIGKWILIYFGFTHCPDICPEELEKMGHIVDIVNRSEVVPSLQPLFISIDPERDTPLAVKNYIADFHPTMIGLTGTRDQVETASRAFRVYYSTGPKDGDEDYLVDHSVIMFLIDENGDFCEYYGQTRSAGEIASNIIATMLKTRKDFI